MYSIWAVYGVISPLSDLVQVSVDTILPNSDASSSDCHQTMMASS